MLEESGQGHLVARGYLGLFSFFFERDRSTLLACLLACFDTAENEPLKVCEKVARQSDGLSARPNVPQVTLTMSRMATAQAGVARAETEIETYRNHLCLF